MNNCEKYLILSDFDGTFAGDNSTVVSRNIEAIERFKSKGGHFTFSTGRLPCVMRRICPEFENIANAPVIMANGAVIYDPIKHRIIEETFFDGKIAREVQKDILSRLPNMKITAYADDGEMQSDVMPDEIVGDKWRKMNFRFTDPDDTVICREILLSEYGNLYNSFRSCYSIAESVDKTVTKGAKINTIRSFLAEDGLDGLITVCLGDFENDINMLESADVPCCPSNAIDEVKRVSKHVLCNHNDGVVADVIELIESGKI